MPPDTIKKIAQYKSKLAELQERLYAELATLPGRYGFASADDFIAAVKQAVGTRPARKAKAAAAPKKRRPRAKITDEMKAQVKALVEAGKTAGEIATEVGISVPSVQNIKKALGLVKPRA